MRRRSHNSAATDRALARCLSGKYSPYRAAKIESIALSTIYRALRRLKYDGPVCGYEMHGILKAANGLGLVHEPIYAKVAEFWGVSAWTVENLYSVF